MPFNGSGTFNRVHDWTDDANAAIDITASRMDAEDDGIATGLSTCVTKDGQTTITANLPMSGYRHTGVANATARDDYAAVGQVQDSAFIYAATAGSANAYTLTLSPAITAYAAGQAFLIKANFTNTGASTININGVGAKNITRVNTNALSGNEILSGGIYLIAYDGTQFQLMTEDTGLEAHGLITGSSTVDGVNISSVTNNGTGDFSLTFSNAASATDKQCVVCSGESTGASALLVTSTEHTSTTVVEIYSMILTTSPTISASTQYTYNVMRTVF